MNTSATVLTFPKAAAPSVATAAMLVEQSICVWTGRKKDKEASADVVRDNGARAGVATVHKMIMGECPELHALSKFAAGARNTHYACTMPWSDSGLRLLPNVSYPKYHEQQCGLQTEFFRLVQVFLEVYENRLNDARYELGDLFKADDYPTVANLRRKFSFDFTYSPVPLAGDWRSNMATETEKMLREQYEQASSRYVQGAMLSVWERAQKALEAMSERLADAADGEKRIFRDSLIDNARDVVDLMGACNVTGDPTMEATRQQLWNTIRAVSADDLRKTPALRRQVKRDVDAIIAGLPGLGM